MTCPDGCPYGCTDYCRLHAEPCPLDYRPEPEPPMTWAWLALALPFVLLLWGVIG